MKSLAALVLTGLATASPAAVGAHPKMHGGRRSALYFQDNNPDGTTIISLNIDLETGLNSNPVRTPTGGDGLLAIKNGTNPPTGKLCYSSSPCQPLCEQASMPRCKSSSDVIVADTTFSQDIVFASDTSIFTANTGSGTISHMVIDPSDPQHPKAAGAPGLVEGGFPNSVAYSPRHELLCAVSSGAGASVTCFGPGPDGGLERRGAAIRLPVIQQTTPPHGPDGTASDIVINPAQTAAFVTVKSNTTAAPGFIYVFPVAPAAGGRAAALAGDRAVVSRPPELNHDFSLTFLSDARAVISDTTFGAALLHIAPDLSVTTEVATRIPGAKAACWTVYAPEFEAIYVKDGANPNVTVLDPAPAGRAAVWGRRLRCRAWGGRAVPVCPAVQGRGCGLGPGGEQRQPGEETKTGSESGLERAGESSGLVGFGCVSQLRIEVRAAARDRKEGEDVRVIDHLKAKSSEM